MITDPRTIPESGLGRRVYAVSVGFLATLLLAPWTSEFAHKVAVLSALAIVCAARPVLLLATRDRGRAPGRPRAAAAGRACGPARRREPRSWP